MNKRRTSKAFRVRAAITLLLLLLTSATAWADTENVSYIDGNGNEQHVNATILTSNTDITAGWYIVKNTNSEGVDVSFSSQVSFNGNTSLILADGASITITGVNGIVVDGNLTIYGQSEGTGSLSVKAQGDGSISGDGIFAQNGQITINGGILSITANRYGITTTNNDITINGGKINVIATGENGIDATGNITITSGNVTANGKNGINATGNITITGGNVTANGSSKGIYASNGNITLGYTNDTDRISANSYEVAGDNSNSISISNGKTMIDGENTYSGTLTATNIINKIFAPNLFGIGPNNDGSISKPYIINSPEGLQLLATYVNSGTICVSPSDHNDIFYVYEDKYFTLNDDIAFNSSIDNNFTPIGGGKFNNNYYAFCGSFDGNGHTISGINIDIDDNNYAGIFGYLESGASISNVTLVNASIRGKEFIGGIVGDNKGGRISNCLVANTTITNSITGNSYIGVITGHNSGTLDLNYYGNVNENATNVGCGTDSSPKDVIENDGAVSATFLTDSKPVPSTLSGKVLFYREFTGGKASTICLPFAYTPKTSDGTFYTFKSVEYSEGQYIATMEEVNKATSPLSANTPYLFMPAGTGTKPILFHGTADYDNSNLGTQSGKWYFYGTYERLTYGTDPFSDPVYGFAAKTKDVGVQGQEQVEAGEFVRAITGAYIPPMRCFLKYNTTSTRGETEELPGRITVKLVGDPTSIGTLNTQTGEVTFDGWYSLDGQRFNTKPTKKGLYIYKGLKVTIK